MKKKKVNSKKAIAPDYDNGIKPYQKIIIAIFVIAISIKYVPMFFKDKCKVQAGQIWQRRLTGTMDLRYGAVDQSESDLLVQVSTDSIYKVDKENNMVYYYYGSDGMTDSCDCKEFLFQSAVQHATLVSSPPEKPSKNK